MVVMRRPDPYAVFLEQLYLQADSARWLLDETRPGVQGRTPLVGKAPLEGAILLMAAAWESYIEGVAVHTLRSLSLIHI